MYDKNLKILLTGEILAQYYFTLFEICEVSEESISS